MRLPAAEPLPFALVAGAGNATLISGRGLFCGFCVEETGGAGAIAGKFWDSQSTNGLRIATFNTVASGALTVFFSAPYVIFNNGVTVQQTGAGAVSGSALVIPASRFPGGLLDFQSTGGAVLEQVTEVGEILAMMSGEYQ